MYKKYLRLESIINKKYKTLRFTFRFFDVQKPFPFVLNCLFLLFPFVREPLKIGMTKWTQKNIQ